MRVDELLSLAKDCLAGRKVLAVDLCGEPSANAPEAECSAASLVNQKHTFLQPVINMLMWK